MELCRKKLALLSLRNKDWKKVKAETEKINDSLTKIPTNNTLELNDLINGGGKLVCGKIEVLWKNTKKKSKPRWEIRLETQVRRLRQRAKILNQMENKRLFSEKQRKSRRLEQNIQLKEINQKVLSKEERLKRYRDRAKQYRQNRTFQNNERKFYQLVRGEWAKAYQEPDARRQRDFGAKYGNR